MGRSLATHDPAYGQENAGRSADSRAGAGIDTLLCIAWKRGHVIEEDQCVSTACLVAIAWAGVRGPTDVRPSIGSRRGRNSTGIGKGSRKAALCRGIQAE